MKAVFLRTEVSVQHRAKYLTHTVTITAALFVSDAPSARDPARAAQLRKLRKQAPVVVVRKVGP